MVTTSDDAELIRRYGRERDEGAFAELVRRYVGLVYHAAVRQVEGNAHTAEDVTQRVFTLLARKAAVLTGHTSLAGWLHATTRNVAREIRRAELRRLMREREAHFMQEFSTERGSVADWERLRPIIDDALEDLSARDREAVLLRFFAGLPLAAVGAKLSLSENAARMRVERALEKLRALLARRGVTSTSAALAVALGDQAVAALPAGLAGSVTSMALAGAGVVSGNGVLASVAVFMGMAKLGFSVAGVVLIAGGLTLAVAEGRARAMTEEAVAGARQDYMRAQARLRDLERRAKIGEERAGQLDESVQQTAAVQSAAASGADLQAPAKAPSRPDAMKAGKAFLERHPDVKKAFLEWNAAVLNARWAPLYRALNLSPAQIERFQTLKRGDHSLAFETSEDDVVTEALTLHVGADVERSAIDDALRDLLGGEGYRAYAEFERTVVARGYVAQIAGALCFSETPLTAAQSEHVTRVLGRNQRSDTRSAATDRPQANDKSPPIFDWDAITRDAGVFLSAPQVAALEAMRTEDRFRQLWNQRANPRAQGR